MSDMQSGNVAGNYYDKYATANPIARHLMRGFLDAFDRLVERSGAHEALEIGCGEGELSMRLARRGFAVRGCDVSPEVVAEARAVAAKAGLDIAFEARSVYELVAPRDAAPLVVCCEVLEHVPDPQRALDILAKLAKPYAVMSVPREPLWRVLNVARLKYLANWGNTPGHIQHWSRAAFLEMVRTRFDVVVVQTPLPWTMVLCRSRSAA